MNLSIGGGPQNANNCKVMTVSERHFRYSAISDILFSDHDLIEKRSSIPGNKEQNKMRNQLIRKRLFAAEWKYERNLHENDEKQGLKFENSATTKNYENISSKIYDALKSKQKPSPEKRKFLPGEGVRGLLCLPLGVRRPVGSGGPAC